MGFVPLKLAVPSQFSVLSTSTRTVLALIITNWERPFLMGGKCRFHQSFSRIFIGVISKSVYFYQTGFEY